MGELVRVIDDLIDEATVLAGSRKRLAQCLGVAVVTLQAWRNGRRAPGKASLEMLAHFLHGNRRNIESHFADFIVLAWELKKVLPGLDDNTLSVGSLMQWYLRSVWHNTLNRELSDALSRRAGRTLWREIGTPMRVGTALVRGSSPRITRRAARRKSSIDELI